MCLFSAFILFITAAAVIIVAGTKLTKMADILADVTGFGEAVIGAVFLGTVTSLPGIITSVVAAFNNYPQLSVSNAIGGIAVQTVFLSIADIFYRDINLEHAAVSLSNLMQGILLIGLLSLVIIGISVPDITIFNIHPVSILLLVGYLAGTKLIAHARKKPMWTPRLTKYTVRDIPKEKNIKDPDLQSIIIKFAVLAIIVAGAGYTVAISGIAIVKKTGLTESFVGTLFTAVVTSMPELIVSVAAVRQKALTLAVGNIIGGNSFDVLFICFSDIVYTKGNILSAVSGGQIFIIGITMTMLSVLILGLLYRERYGIGKIGWESALNIVLYITGAIILYFNM
ncbi:MAG: hypothetical protein K9M56_06845 [Victivallales bacterium]|nr:hypothetical protein [Victivallales bacterium]